MLNWFILDLNGKLADKWIIYQQLSLPLCLFTVFVGFGWHHYVHLF
jgi:hypothetical protein